jgi:hypothetical protein
VSEDEIGTVIIASAMKVHSAVGAGLLESAYETCFGYLLNFNVARMRDDIVRLVNGL